MRKKEDPGFASRGTALLHQFIGKDKKKVGFPKFKSLAVLIQATRRRCACREDASAAKSVSAHCLAQKCWQRKEATESIRLHPSRTRNAH